MGLSPRWRVCLYGTLMLSYTKWRTQPARRPSATSSLIFSPEKESMDMPPCGRSSLAAWTPRATEQRPLPQPGEDILPRVWPRDARNCVEDQPLLLLWNQRGGRLCRGAKSDAGELVLGRGESAPHVLTLPDQGADSKRGFGEAGRVSEVFFRSEGSSPDVLCHV